MSNVDDAIANMPAAAAASVDCREICQTTQRDAVIVFVL